MVSMETKHRIGLCNVIQMSSFLLLDIRSGKSRKGLIACTLLCPASAHKQNYKIQFCSEFLLFRLVNLKMVFTYNELEFRHITRHT